MSLHAKASTTIPKAVAGTRCHEMKVWPEFYAAIKRGDKRFEIRWNDRSYAPGDTAWLREYEPPKKDGDSGKYTGNEMYVHITYVIHGKMKHAITPGYCVMSIKLIEEDGHATT